MAVRCLSRWGPCHCAHFISQSCHMAMPAGQGPRYPVVPQAWTPTGQSPTITLCGPLSLRGNQPSDNRDERRGDKEGKAGPLREHLLSGGLSGMGTP